MADGDSWGCAVPCQSGCCNRPGNPAAVHCPRQSCCALDTAFCLRRVGAKNVDVEGVQRPSELGHAVALDCAGAIDPKDAMLVAVERDRFAMCLEIFPRRLEVVEGRFRLNKLQVHQAAGGVVNIDEQGGLRATVLEPPVLGAIDLNKLTQAIAPRARLMNAFQSVLPPNPKAGADHPLPQCLDAEVQAMKLGQLFGRQGRTKIAIALAHDGQHRLAEHRTQSSVAGPATLPRNHTVRAARSECIQQTASLSSPNPDQPRGVRARPPSVSDIDQHPQTPQLVAAHRDHRHPTPPRQAPCRPSNVTSLSVRPVTFLSVIYIGLADNRRSGKSLELSDAITQETVASNSNRIFQRGRCLPTFCG